jgi:hypothetical protein
MAVPQIITFITLGSRDVPALPAFYAGWDGTANVGSREAVADSKNVLTSGFRAETR